MQEFIIFNISKTPQLSCYLAPEVLQGNISITSDIYSLGIIMLELLSVEFRLDNKKDSSKTQIFIQNIKDDISISCFDVLRSMLQTDPHKRILAFNALHHQWFTKMKGVIENNKNVLKISKGVRNKLLSTIIEERNFNLSSGSFENPVNK